MNTGISRFVIRFPEKIALLEGLEQGNCRIARSGGKEA